MDYNYLRNKEQMRIRKTLPAQRRPIIRVPPIDVLTTGITSANSASNTLYQATYWIHL